MAFNGTAKDIHLEDDHMLCVKLRNNSQDYVDASLDLNDVVQNTNGFLSVDLASELIWRKIAGDFSDLTCTNSRGFRRHHQEHLTHGG